jgi:hypothetical protein
MGVKNATSRLERRLREGPRPRLIVSSGFAGALTEGLPLYGLITAVEVVCVEQGVAFRAIPMDQSEVVRCNLGSLTALMVDNEERRREVERLVRESECSAKDGLDAQGLPIAVDMETMALAKVAMTENIPLLVLRVITDTAEAPLPAFLRSYAEAMSKERLLYGAWRLAASAIREPVAFVRLVKESGAWAKALSKGWEKHAAAVLEIARIN